MRIKRTKIKAALVILFAVLISLSMITQPTVSIGEEPSDEHVDGYIIKLSSEIEESEKNKLEVISEENNVYYADTYEDINEIDSDIIESVVPNTAPELKSPATIESPYNDPQYSKQYNLEMTRAYAVKYAGMDAEGVRIGIIDSGIYNDHEDLDYSRIEQGYDYIAESTNTNDVGWHLPHSIGGQFGHGTAVAGAIAAVSDNELGFASIADKATIIPLKVELGNPYFSWKVLLQALYDSADKYHCNIVSTGYYYQGDAYGPETDAIEYITNKGVVVVAATGNDNNSNPSYPANYTDVIAVGSIDSSNTNRSSNSYRTFVVAPAVSIPLLGLGRSSYQVGSGTSFAAPQIVAFIAVAKSYDSSLSLGEIRTILSNSSVDIGEPGYDKIYGHGRIDGALFVYNLTGEDYMNLGDIDESHWGYDPINHAIRYGLIDIDDSGNFYPDINMTRGDFITSVGHLYEAEGGTIPEKVNKFVDVPNNSEYSKYIAWGVEAGIINGVTATHFKPGDLVTREQMVVMIHRYHKYLKITDITRRSVTLDIFTDKNTISNFALESIDWAFGQGLINGVAADKISPRSNCTRAEVSQVLYTYRNLY